MLSKQKTTAEILHLVQSVRQLKKENDERLRLLLGSPVTTRLIIYNAPIKWFQSEAEKDGRGRETPSLTLNLENETYILMAIGCFHLSDNPLEDELFIKFTA